MNARVTPAPDTGETAPTLTALALALQLFASRFGRPVSRSSLCADLPVTSADLGEELLNDSRGLSLFATMADRAGFRSQLVQRALPEIGALLLPCILLLRERGAVILTRLDLDTAQAEILVPAARGKDGVKAGERVVSLALLQQHYLGFAWLLNEVVPAGSEEQVGRRQHHWFGGALAPLWPVYGHVLLASVAINLFVLATPLFTMNVYDRVVPNAAFDTLWVLTIGVMIVYSADLVMRLLRSRLLELAGRQLDVVLSARLFAQVCGLPASHWPTRIGAFAANLREFDSIRNFMTSASLASLVDLPFAVLFLLVIALIAGPLVWVPLLFIGLIIGYSLLIRKPLQRCIESGYEAGAARNALLIESLHNMDSLRTHNASGFIQWQWQEASAALASTAMRSQAWSGSVSIITNLLVQLGTVVMVVMGVYQVQDQQLTLGGLLAAVIIGSRAVAPMAQIATLITSYGQTRSAWQRLDELMQLPQERPSGRSFTAMAGFHQELRLQELVFAYPGAERATLQQLNLVIRKGEKVGIIGRSGSGKSTLLRLLPALYEPQEGRVLIDGVDVRQLDPADVRRHLACVGQDERLLRGTLRDNLLLRNRHASDEEIQRAVLAAGLDPLIQRMPLGLDTPVGEQGSGLSGGQRQSLILARALLDEAPVLLLDEPTSAMDSMTELLVRQRLQEYCRHRTLVLVTHKQSMLALVERLVVLDEGRILMDGPRDQVLQALARPATAATAGAPV